MSASVKLAGVEYSVYSMSASSVALVFLEFSSMFVVRVGYHEKCYRWDLELGSETTVIFVAQTHIVSYLLAHLIGSKQWPGLWPSTLPRMLLQFLQILDQVCVFITIMRRSGFCRRFMPHRSEAVRTNVDFSQYHRLRLMLVVSSFFFLCCTWHPSFLSDCNICGFEVLLSDSKADHVLNVYTKTITS